MTDQKLLFPLPLGGRGERRKEMSQLVQWCRSTIMLGGGRRHAAFQMLTWQYTGNQTEPRGSAADSAGLLFFYVLSSSAGDFPRLSSDSGQRRSLSITYQVLSLRYRYLSNCTAICAMNTGGLAWMFSDILRLSACLLPYLLLLSHG